MILLSFCRDMAVLARGKTRGLLLQCLHGGTITNLLQNDNDKFLVPKQSFWTRNVFFLQMLMIIKIEIQVLDSPHLAGFMTGV